MGFELKGGIDPNNKDTVLAYTLGEGKWLSDTAVNLQVLRDETKMKSEQTVGKNKKKKNLLFVSVPPEGGLKRWFDLLKNPKNNYSKLTIYIYADGNQSYADPDSWLVFHNIKPLGDGFNPPKLFGVNATFFTFDYESVVPYKR